MSETVTIKAFKAASVQLSKEPQSTIIEIIDTIADPPMGKESSMEEVNIFFNNQASILADALFGSLPQGTLDRLLIKMMQKHVSCYIGVPERR